MSQEEKLLRAKKVIENSRVSGMSAGNAGEQPVRMHKLEIRPGCV